MAIVVSERKQQRRAYVAPLFAYCADHCIAPLMLARRAAIRASAHSSAHSSSHASAHTPAHTPVMLMNKLRLSRIKLGHAAIPPWFIAAMCREIGQPIEVVMGAEWAQRHLPALAPDLAPAHVPAHVPHVAPKQRAS